MNQFDGWLAPRKRWLRALLAVGLAGVALAGRVNAGLLEDIGYTALVESGELRAYGRGVKVGLIEAPLDPDFGSFQFSPDISLPGLSNKSYTFNPIEGTVSPHATLTASVFFGGSGLAPGVTDVQVHQLSAYTGGTALNRTSMFPPSRLGLSVINNSWTGSVEDVPQDLDIIRRVDFMIRRDNVVSVHAVNNGRDSVFPILLATSYNGITVGTPAMRKRGFAGSSVGPVKFDGPGNRAKIDLVVPVGTTSEAAAAVSGAAALLISEAKAQRMKLSAMTTKAVLMASADRPKGWNKGGKAKKDDRRVPLDYEWGAGLLRVDRAFDVMSSGKATKLDDLDEQGWDTRRVGKNKTVSYELELKDPARELDVVLTWQRKILSEFPFERSRTALSDMDLMVYRGMEIEDEGKHGRNRGKGGGDDEPRIKWKLVGRSQSKVDNVETVFARNLPEGLYKIVVRSDAKDYFGLAWDADYLDEPASLIESPDPRGLMRGIRAERVGPVIVSGSGFGRAVPEPSILGGIVAGGMMLMGRRRRGRG